MTGDEIRTLAIKLAQQLPKVELSYPFGEGVEVFKIMNKIFMMSFSLQGNKIINLKADPDHGDMLRDISLYTCRLSHE